MRYLISEPWDYLVLSASNEKQAAYYAKQLKAREWLGLLHPFKRWLVVPDSRGNVRGSGSSTFLCLRAIIDDVRHTPLVDCQANDSRPHSENEMDTAIPHGPGDSHAFLANHSELSKSNSTGDSANDSDRDARQSPASQPPESILSSLRVLIIHAGGDSRRLPVYAHLGKCFIPIPGESDSALHLTLFDKQIEVLSKLPATTPGHGQIVITSGDVLLRLDPKEVEFADAGITFVAARETAETCTKHGVYVCDENGRLRRFLQKPTIAEMKAAGALDANGQGLLDIGLMSFDGETATRLLELEALTGQESKEIDLYREICCALGIETSIEQYVADIGRSETGFDDTTLQRIFNTFSPISTHVHIADRCEFLHFGTMPQLIQSGMQIKAGSLPWIDIRNWFDLERPTEPAENSGFTRKRMRASPDITHVELTDLVTGGPAWIEGCRIAETTALGGNNLLLNLNISVPCSIPPNKGIQVHEVCLADANPQRCVRLYDHLDDYKRNVLDSITILGAPLDAFLDAASIREEQLWDPTIPRQQRNLWNAKLHPLVEFQTDETIWAQLLAPLSASSAIWEQWRLATRISHHQAVDAFHFNSLAEPPYGVYTVFLLDNGFSARDLAYVFLRGRALDSAVQRYASEWNRLTPQDHDFPAARLSHSLASSQAHMRDSDASLFFNGAPASERLLGHKYSMGRKKMVPRTPRALQNQAYKRIQRVILATEFTQPIPSTSACNTLSVTAPVRFDLAGGWTDTPPYTLERGGCVLNAAIDLEGVAPIETRISRIAEPVVRIRSRDHGRTIEIDSLKSLLDYAKQIDAFGLAKAAVVHATIFRREGACFSGVIDALGGGIEITTHSRVPSGSGLGASSIVGATLITAINHIMGRELSNRALFFAVLQLEQMLTTGGGWQDQIGGVIGGMKLIETEPGLVPDPHIHTLSHALIDPAQNGGATLLYYTGLTRLAKNILQQVVGRYLDRDRAAMAALAEIRLLPSILSEAIESNDYELFGRVIGAGWELKKRLDPGSTTPEIEMLFRRAKPHVFGATLLGAGGGGFMLLVCRSRDDAAHLRNQLEASPPNPHARFYDYGINTAGMRVDAR